MVLASAAAIAGLASAGVGIGKSLFGNSGGQSQQSFNILAQQLADARNNVTNAQIGGAGVNQLARAGFSDSQGSSLRFDPATNQWVSTLGPLPQQAQTASDQATIARNTTDMGMARAANEQAGVNAARAQPLIDAARRRMENFQPITGNTLSGLLAQRVSQANNQTFQPMVQDVLTQYARSSANPGDALARLGRESGTQLRQGLMDAQIQGMTGAEGINNQRRQGLQSDLASAQGAGTAQFQFPTIATNNPNKDLLAALTSRANVGGYTAAQGLNAVTGAINASGLAANQASAAVPNPQAGLNNLTTGLDSLSKFLGTDAAKKGLDSLTGLFGKPFTDPNNS